MSCSRDRLNKRGRKAQGLRSGEDVNPMESLSNLADAMLVLAVGIMVALVLHWNVDLVSGEESGSTAGAAATFNGNDLTDEEVPESARHAGEVYYDEETDAYYIIRDAGTQP